MAAMTVSRTKTAPTERLRPSPSFALTFTLDGRPYIAKETEPYIQYWLSERYRILLSMFSRRGGATTAEALEGYLRLTGAPRTGAEEKRLLRAIDDMREGGVLIGARDDVSRYGARIVADYLMHRPFPRELSDLIIRAAPVVRESRVLDLAGGPGDLALALARASDHVCLMELSKGFLAAARKRAKELGLDLTPIHDSANRLVFRDEEFDVVTVSQALHWLDDVLVCRGLCRKLRPDGSFFVIHAAFEVEDDHPLSFILGHRSILGEKARQDFAAEVRPLLRRLTLLFEALDAPDVQRIDISQHFDAAGAAPRPRIAPAGVSLFRQRRPMGLGFARAFLTEDHIAATGKGPAAFWREVEARCAAAAPGQIIGTYHWAVLHFRRGGTRAASPPPDMSGVVEIGYHGPPEG
jgi:2-polyprenyl-3-methyl-5-hydroxy-6-metoxy-1,4-benzoquinol methylase